MSAGVGHTPEWVGPELVGVPQSVEDSIRHLDGLRDGYQVTVTNHGEWADCKVWTPGCNSGHGCPGVESTEHDSFADAMAHGEQRATELRAFTKSAAQVSP